MGEYNQPAGWSVPEQLAKKLGIAMNEKPRTDPMVNLIEILKYSAKAIADIESDPADWADWMGYLMKLLEVEATKDFKTNQFEQMMRNLDNVLAVRKKSGKW